MKQRAGATGPARGALSGIAYEPAFGLSPAVGIWLADDFAWAGSESASGGGTGDHATLSNLTWTASGHTGTASRIAAFDGGGAASYLAIGTDVQAYDADLAALAALASNGLIARTGAGTVAARTLTGTAPITVTNGDGVSGNPTVAVSSATSSAAGVAEYATWCEGQTTSSALMEDPRNPWNIYRSGFSLWGAINTSPWDNNVVGSGTATTLGTAGTFTAAYSSTYGYHLTFPTSTSTTRGWSLGDGAGAMTWSKAGHCRYLARFGADANITMTFGLVYWSSSSGLNAWNNSAAIRFGINAGAIKCGTANVTSFQTTTFSTAFTAGRIYEWEIIVDRALADVVFVLYDWTEATGRGAELERQTISSYIPTDAVSTTAIVPQILAISTSGTPTAYIKSLEVVNNIT